jgi:hypothetical protein
VEGAGRDGDVRSGVRGEERDHRRPQELGHRGFGGPGPPDHGDGGLVRKPGLLEGGPVGGATVVPEELEVGDGVGAEENEAGVVAQPSGQQLRRDAGTVGQLSEGEGDDGFRGEYRGRAVEDVEGHGGLRLSGPPS